MIETADKTYIVLVSYLVPVEGTLVIPGKDEDDVRTKTLELFQNRINVNIVSINCVDEADQASDDDNTNVIVFDPTNKKKT